MLAAVVLTAYYWSTAAADRIDNWRSRLIWLAFLLKAALEVTTTSSMYATGKSSSEPQSLWFQTCSMTPDQISLFGSAINLPQFCSMQVRAPLFVTY
jgi:hypothetical protein